MVLTERREGDGSHREEREGDVLSLSPPPFPGGGGGQMVQQECSE